MRSSIHVLGVCFILLPLAMEETTIAPVNENFLRFEIPVVKYQPPLANNFNDIAHQNQLGWYSSVTKEQLQSKESLENSSWYAGALQHIEASEYQFKWEEKYKAYCTPNRKNNLRFFYDEKGFTVEPARTKIPLVKEEPGQTLSEDQYKHIPDWKVAFNLDRQLIANGHWQVKDDKAEYITDQLTIQYINGKEGMRQNFIVPAPLTGNDELQIDFSVQTKLETYLHGNQLQFIHPVAGNVLNYAGLKVWDAAGKELPAELQKSKEGYCIKVNTETAVYPVTIDPLSSTPDEILNEANQTLAQFGFSVASAGDVNGDGYSDVVIGALSFDDGGNNNEGRAFVYYGSPAGLSNLADRILQDANQADALFGVSVASAGDVNGDGYSDVIVGAHRFDDGGNIDEGLAFVYYGSSAGLSASANSTPNDADQADAFFGRSVSSAGDVNNDGYSDVIIGAVLYDGVNADEGRAFIYYGSAAGLSASPNSIVDDANQAGAQLGSSVASAGDVNGDGFSDVLIGVPSFNNGANLREGRVFVYYGAGAGIPGSPSIILGVPNQGTMRFGTSVASAGDVNGDGFSDVVIGAPLFDDGANLREGRAFVFHGSAAGLSASPATILSDGNQANISFSSSVACAGDLNGDGYSDVVIGAPGYNDDAAKEGAAFVYYGSATGLSATFNYKLDDANQADAQFGTSVASAGDVNGDGFSDVIVGAPLYSDGANLSEGWTFVYHGAAAGLSALPVSALDTDQFAGLGYSVASAGDVNGDGFSDVIIGAPFLDDGGFSIEGLAFVYHGSAAGLSTIPNSTLDDANLDNSFFGFSVASAGDVNGDGYSDVIIGAFRYTDGLNTDEGRAFVYYGSPAGLSASPNSILHDADQANALFGFSVASAGDVNGDGYSDVVVGAYTYDDGPNTDEGRAFVYYGSVAGLSVLANNIPDDANQPGAGFGASVASAGDVNGDGFSDVIIGASFYDDDNSDEGKAFVYYGSAAGLSALPVSTPDDANQLNANFGSSVASAGDVNSDGFSDVIIGAYNFNDGVNGITGGAFVYHGSAAGLSASPNSILDDANNTGALFGYSVASAGDVNGDGYSDVIIGAPFYDSANSDEGRAFVYHGSAAGLSALPVNTPDDAGQANAWFGWSVAFAGDVNGDGYSDVIIGAPNYDNGRAFLYYGNDAPLTNTRYNIRLYNADGITPVNQTNFNQLNFNAGLYSRFFLGRQRVKMVWETRVSYGTFSGTPITNSVSFTSEQPVFTSLAGGIEFKSLIAKIPGARYTKIRARVKYSLATAITGQVYGPWRYILSPVDGNNRAVLPVELLSFKASWIEKGKTATIDFTTDKEDGTTCCFDIEKSTDGINFVTIAGLPATNAPGIQRYHYLDNNATAGKQYYRLKIKDKDGGVKYSNIALLQHNGAAEIIAFPNPATDVLQLELNKNYDRLDISILNSAGQLVKQLNKLPGNTQLVKIPVSELPPGVYWLQLQSGQEKQTIQFIKQ
ncbi:MAG: FG-GAP repeat protein [Chitinophagaceae bacterium]|nr:FG-GAP repeat protein [Chitinophagaceae bacterium]